MTERYLKNYLHQASHYLDCAAADRRQFEQQIRSAVQEIEKEQPDGTWEECVHLLGTPRQAACEYMQDFSAEYVDQYRKKRRFWLGAGIAALVLSAAILLGATCYWWFVKEFTVVEIQPSITEAVSLV